MRTFVLVYLLVFVLGSLALAFYDVFWYEGGMDWTGQGFVMREIPIKAVKFL